ncbi:MAG: FHA domain-containing protein [Phototrophicaceae bacterium]
MPRLKMLRGPFPDTEFELNEAVMTIGRGHKNDVIIQDNEVSRTHCRLVRVLDDYEIHDLGSTNGTFVNGKKVDEGGWLLSGNTLVELGDSITLEYSSNEMVTGTRPPTALLNDIQKEKVFYLVIEQQAQDQPEIYVLDRLSITIGRDTDNDISLDAPEVSRHHMRLVLTVDGYTLEDLNTMNGTSVNREKITHQQILHHNDMIGVGTSLHMWYTDDPDSLLASLNNKNFIALDDDTSQVLALLDETNDHFDDDLSDEVVSDVRLEIGHGLSAGDLAHSVFLNYAREEWTVIGRHIYTYLEDNNIKTFTQQYLTPETDDWHKSMEQALSESPCLLAIISEKSVEVPAITRSIRHFIAREKPVLLLRYGKIDKLPMILHNMPAIRFDPKNPDKTSRMILAELRRVGL